MKVHEALRRASSFLRENGREPRAAEILLCHFLGLTRTKLFQSMQDEVPEKVENPFEKACRAHGGGMPVQYITGEEEFFGRPFKVNRNVLIPRPETEELVETVLATAGELFGDRRVDVVDVGTGSGAIAVTLALENPRLSVSAVDLSPAALTVARENAQLHDSRVTFYEGDLLAPLIEKGMKADVIVSNPPYISEEDADGLDPLVRDHEPGIALFAGRDGLDIYRRLISQLREAMNPSKGIVALEVGIGQSGVVSEMMRGTFGESVEVSVKKDINGKERIVVAVFRR
ncbi:MAG TPA: peptide chain release factor N(5)-glutamine methyltransferase [Bacillales bacterium]|nr:peptide chain release factor N(5)-glutamine methyltransferase [Bacillales bacterium]